MNVAPQHSPLSERWLAIVGALISLCLAIPLLITINRLYASSEVELSRSRVQQEVVRRANALSAAIDRRLHVLPALKVFLEQNDQDPAASENLLLLAQALHAGSAGIRTIQVLDDGAVRFRYPQEESQVALAYDLLEDPRPEMRKRDQEALAAGEIAITGPIELAQGGPGLVARLAVADASGNSTGLVAVVIDLPLIIREAGLEGGPDSLQVHLTDREGHLIFGTIQTSGDRLESHLIQGRGWQIHASPTDSWHADALAHIRLFEVATGSAVLFLVAFVYTALSNHTRLDRKVRERTVQLSGANRELADRRAELETLLSSIPDLVFVLDGDCRYLEAHTAHPESLLLPKRDFLGRTIHEVLPPEIAHQAQGLVDEALAHPGTTARGQYALQLSGITPNQFDANVIAIPSANGARVLWVSRDVTELHRAREELKEIDVALRLAMPGIARLGRDGKYQRVNRVFADMLGFAPGDLEGQPALHLVPDAGAREFQATMEKARETGEAELELSLVRQDESPFDARMVMVRRTHSAGGYQGAHIFMRDNSEHKAREQASRDIEQRLSRAARLESLGTLAGGVAHDLNNILGPLVGYPDIILADLDQDDPLRDDVICMKESALRAGAIIQDLLTMARRGRYTARPSNLNTVILEYLESMPFHSVQARHPGIVLIHSLADEPLLLNGSKHHLGQVIMNLVINAYESIVGPGTVEITTSAEIIDTETDRTYEPIAAGEYVTCRISDNGSGIPSTDLERIFEPFFSNKKLGNSGSGLGLAVVYGVVKDHHGFVDVSTTPDQGTTFTLYFPVTRDESIEEAPVEDASGGNESVLVVDDVEAQRKLARRLLGRLGYQVTTAVDGQDALRALQQDPVDLVVLDMIMEEGFDGLDVYREIRKIRPGQRCIIASGFAATDRVREALRLGAGAFIQKPYTMRNIGAAIRAEMARDRLA